MASNDQSFAKMSKSEVEKIASEGGKATGGKNLDTAARKKGGERSRGGGRRS